MNNESLRPIIHADCNKKEILHILGQFWNRGVSLILLKHTKELHSHSYLKRVAAHVWILKSVILHVHDCGQFVPKTTHTRDNCCSCGWQIQTRESLGDWLIKKKRNVHLVQPPRILFIWHKMSIQNVPSDDVSKVSYWTSFFSMVHSPYPMLTKSNA